jgi:predicted HTH transcriptional regulator
MSDNDDKQYKSIDSAFAKQIRSDLEINMQKFRDPIILGELAYRLTDERENTNRILKNILQKLEALEARQASPESDTAHMEAAHHPPGMDDLLPEIDEQILAFIREAGKVTAEEVRARFNYKGKNAASARLNRLYGIGVLLKKQVGRKTYFFPS